MILLLHTASWFFINAWPDLQKQTIDSLRQIHIGYYLWLLAYGLLFWAHCIGRKVPSRDAGVDAGNVSVFDAPNERGI